MKKIGAVSGKFRILHNAHKEYILKATLYVDVLHIFIVDDPSIQRYSTILETKKAICKILQEIDIEYYIHFAPKTNTMQEWDEYVIGLLKRDDIMMFNSKEEYTNILLPTGYINCQHALSISASEIEKNPYLEHNFSNIAQEYMPYLNKKIAISGVENTGKTQFIKKVSRIYLTSHSEDMKKSFRINEYNDPYGQLTIKDIDTILHLQFINNLKMNEQARRFLIIDNDYPMILNELLELEKMTNDVELFTKVKTKLEVIINENKNDLTIVIKPKINSEKYQRLIKIYQQNNINYIEVDLANYVDTYEEIAKNINCLLK